MAHWTCAGDGKPPDEALCVKHVSAQRPPRPGAPFQGVAADAAVVVGEDLLLCRTLQLVRHQVCSSLKDKDPACTAMTKVIPYRVNLVVVDLGWVDFDLDVPPFCLAAQPILPNSHLPKQNWAENGTLKIKVNLTQVSDQMKHPGKIHTIHL